MAERLIAIRRPARRWIDWWGALGGGAAAVAAIWPQAERSVAEPTAALRERSIRGWPAPWWSIGRRGEAQRRVIALDAVPDGGTQMVWANMMLHWVADEAATIERWQRALEHDGLLMFSTFGPLTLRALRELYAQAGWAPPHAPFTDMHDLGDMLLHAGFAGPVMDQETLTLTWSSAGAALAELRALGGNCAIDRCAGLRTPRWRAQLCSALEAQAAAHGRVTLDFEIVYGHAIKPGHGAGNATGVGETRQPIRVHRTKAA